MRVSCTLPARSPTVALTWVRTMRILVIGSLFYASAASGRTSTLR